MAVVEASPASRAVCRECGSAIVSGEPRFGREEGSSDARRMRWRHLICAAQNLPDALLHALELGGWRSVPDEDHDELRGLIDGARAARRRPTPAPAVQAEPHAARSSSAMAAAAVLEPAHQTRSLPPEQARAWVFADALQAQGDPRGELLALELAAAHTDDPVQARALQRERNRCWKAFDPRLRASEILHLRWVGGFLLAGYPKQQHELHRLLASPAATSLTRIRVDFCTREELSRLVGAATTHRRPLAVVELPHSRSNDLTPLASLPELALLRVGDRFDPRVLGLLGERPGLRGLSLLGDDQVGLAELAPIAESLELLELCAVAAARVEGLGRRLPALEQLRLTRARIEGEPEFLRGAARLRSLRLPDSPLSSLGPIAALPSLRELELVPGKLRLVAELEPLAALERLALSGSKVGELEPLAALSACEHLGLSSTSATKLEPLAALPRLRSLVIEGGDMRRVSGLAALTELERLRLTKLANLDVAALAGFERLHTLVLDPGGRRPRSLDTLARLPALRRVSAPVELLTELDARSPILSRVEVLELTGAAMPQAKDLAALPRLRAVLLPGREPAQIEALAEALPELALLAELPPRDRLGRRDPFDWRAVEWPY